MPQRVPEGPAHRPRERAILTWSAIDRQTRLLELCGLESAQHVAILAAPGAPPEWIELCSIATERIGASRTIVTVGAEIGAAGPVASAAARAADLVVDLSGLSEEEAWRSARGAQTKVLIVDGAALLAPHDLQPHPGVARRARLAAELMRFGSTATVTTAAGTRLDVMLKGNETVVETGIPDATSSVAAWPGGRVCVRPLAGTVSGVVVLMPGDLIADLGHLVRSPLSLRIEADHITEIESDATDADLLRAHLEAGASDDAYAIGEVTLGLTGLGGAPLGRFDQRLLRTGDGSRRAGVIGLATGASTQAGRRGVGGTQLCLREASLAVDGVDLLCAGVLEGGLALDPYETATS